MSLIPFPTDTARQPATAIVEDAAREWLDCHHRILCLWRERLIESNSDLSLINLVDQQARWLDANLLRAP